jgi:hypothetical protein
LAQGPEEKRASCGRATGIVVVIFAILSDVRLSLGRGVPPSLLKEARADGK